MYFKARLGLSGQSWTHGSESVPGPCLARDLYKLLRRWDMGRFGRAVVWSWAAVDSVKLGLVGCLMA